MSCEVTATIEAPPPQEETSIFAEDWKNYSGEDPLEGLGLVTDFNSNFDFSGGGHVDPQEFSMPAISSGTPTSLFSTTNDEQVSMDQIVDSDPTYLNSFDGDLGSYDTSFLDQAVAGSEMVAHNAQRAKLTPTGPSSGFVSHQRTSAMHQQTTPHFYPSIELPAHGHQYHQQLYPLLIPHHHFQRRSVSEPPIGPGLDNLNQGVHYISIPGLTPQQQQQPEITFHRPNHYIGTAEPQRANGTMDFKRIPKRRNQPQSQPYPTSGSIKRGVARSARQRPEIKRARTQPARSAPTSAPASPAASDPPFMSSRAGTPTSMPDPEMVLSPLLEPQDGNETPTAKYGALDNVDGKGRAFWTSMSAERLQGLIAEAVRKALEDSRVGGFGWKVESAGMLREGEGEGMADAEV